jgi:AcrR family transcriptional regulator
MVRRTADEAEQTRQAIVDAARSLFATRGFAATPTEDVVAAAGVTRGALYHHFADKAALFREVFAQLSAELDRTVNAAARAAAASGSVPEAFAAGCGAVLDFMVRPDYHQIAVVDAPSVLGSEAWHDVDAGLGLATTRAGLRALAEAGALRVAYSDALAVAVFGALTEAGIVLSRRAPGSPGRDELLAAILGLVLERKRPNENDDEAG